jgi:DNA-binding CsgD family transcriptional regulator
VPQRHSRPFQAHPQFRVAQLKARQSAKMRELREALVASGFTSLDERAQVLGLSRSTAWTILNGNHKSYGLSAGIVNRMLLAPRLPPLVRTKIREYIEEKAAGHYGHSNGRRRKFTQRLLIEHLSDIPDCNDARWGLGSR